MRKYSTNVIRAFTFALCILLFALCSCTATKQSLAVKDENVNLKVEETPNVLDYAVLEKQNIPKLADRLETSRGIPIAMLGGAVSLATDLIKKMIAKDREKY